MDKHIQGNGTPELSSAPGWPLILYFHHVAEQDPHYTVLSSPQFRTALETITSCYGDFIDPRKLADVGPGYGGRPCALLTFDDGYHDNICNAEPILKEFGAKAIFFVVTDAITRASSRSQARQPSDAAAYLTWNDLMHLRNAGHVIANHTTSHRRLSDCTKKEQLIQVRDADRVLKTNLGESPGLVAYPYGDQPTAPVLLPTELGFATVRASPLPWRGQRAAAHAIRRTYLPANAADEWRRLCARWRFQWYG